MATVPKKNGRKGVKNTNKHENDENRYIQRDMVVDIRKMKFKLFIPARPETYFAKLDIQL